MTLRAADSFDLATTAQFTASTARWTMAGTAARWSIVAARNGNGAFLQNSQSNGSAAAFRDFDNQATWIAGFAFSLGTISTNDHRIIGFQDSATEQIGLYVRAADSKLELRRNGTVLATSALPITAGQWNYIEVKVTIAATGGLAEVRLNQAVNMTFSGNTRFTANAYANRVQIGSTQTPTSGGGTALYQCYYDDYYLNDGNGSLNNGYSGDVLVKALYPTAAGATTDFTPSAGANYAAVDEAQPNDDTDYVSSTTVGHIDTYAYEDLPANANSVKGVLLVQRMRKDDAGGRTMKAIVRSGGANYEHADAKAITQTYVTYESVSELNPDTAAQWTPAGVNAAEFGAKVES